MSDTQKRQRLTEVISDMNAMKLNQREKELFHWLLYEQPTLEHVTVEENAFY